MLTLFVSSSAKPSAEAVGEGDGLWQKLIRVEAVELSSPPETMCVVGATAE